jgi:hypothetical protein
MEAALDTLSQSVLGAIVVLLFGACGFLIKQLLKAKDEKIAQVTQMADRLINQANETHALVEVHNQYYEALARETAAATAAVRRAEKTVEAHAFSCPHVDTAKFISIRGQGGT